MIFGVLLLSVEAQETLGLNEAESAQVRIRSSSTILQTTKLVANDGAMDDQFGRSVAISGDLVVVGAAGDDDQGGLSGSAYVFARNQGGPNAWGQIAKLTANDGTVGDSFGLSVSVSGDLVVVGAPADNNSGSAYVFARNQSGPNAWGQVAKLTTNDVVANDAFGTSVSISNDQVVVGASRGHISNTGSAYVFARNQGGSNAWGQVAKLIANDGMAGDFFGVAVSISGDQIIVGAPDNDDQGNNSGSAYIFARNQGGPDAWGQVAKLLASDGAANDHFANAVSISSDQVVVGAALDSDQGSSSGSAYIFARNQGGPNAWGQVAKLIANDGMAGDFFGGFGDAVSISGDQIAVGAFGDNDRGSASGSAYVFARSQGGSNTWGQVAKLTANDGMTGDNFGFSVAISANQMVIGAYQDDIRGSGSGSAYLFQGGDNGDSVIFRDGFEP